MEGILEMIENNEWVSRTFILHDSILMFINNDKRCEIQGRIHLGVSSIILNEQGGFQDDCEINLRSGIDGADLRFRTKSSQEKNQWIDAIVKCQTQYKIKKRMKKAIRQKLKQAINDKKIQVKPISGSQKQISQSRIDSNGGVANKNSGNFNEIAMNFPTNVFSNSCKYVQAVKKTRKLQIQLDKNFETLFEKLSAPKYKKVCLKLKEEMVLYKKHEFELLTNLEKQRKNMMQTTKKMVQMRNAILEQHAQDIKGAGLAKYIIKRQSVKGKLSMGSNIDFLRTQNLPSGREKFSQITERVKYNKEAPIKTSESMVLGAKVLNEVGVSFEESKSDESAVKDKDGTSLSLVAPQPSPHIIQKSKEVPNFKGTQIFTFNDSRTQLPFFRPENEVVPVWSIIKKFIGQDLTRVSMPVIMSEPISSNQRCCELQVRSGIEEILSRAAQEEDSVKRIALTMIHATAMFNDFKYRVKKQFNPMLGETFEMVTEKYRFMSEQVSHHPPITAFQTEGQDYLVEGFTASDSKFKMGNGTGQMEIVQHGLTNYKYTKFGDYITITKPFILAKNIIMGQLFLDISGKVEAVNHNSGEKVILNCKPRQWSKLSEIDGQCFDKNGKLKYTISGSWLSQITLTDASSKTSEVIWKELSLIPDYKKQFSFALYTILLNYRSQEMEGVIAPTDSRFRNDQRFFEEGNVDAADKEKIRLEVKQRTSRKQREDDNIQFQPVFFKEVQHPHFKESKYYQIIDGENGYWQRRESQDWQGLMDLWS